MKHADIQKLHEAGLISEAQRQKIIERFKLKEDGGKFLTIISTLGALLIVGGIILLISANWEVIPRGMKIATGLLLMLSAHAGGWWLREVQGKYHKTGEALHLIGSGLFLGNIALLGQIYHLSSREPNALLLWWLGIAALPWLLRSTAHHVLALLAFWLWLGVEINQDDSLIRLRDEYQVLLYALMGLVWLGFGCVLRRGAFSSFAAATERLGLLVFLLFVYPLTWKGFLGGYQHAVAGSFWMLPLVAAAAMALILAGAKNLSLNPQWRWTWTLTLGSAAALTAGVLFVPRELDWRYFHEFTPVNAFAAVALFVFCLLQIQAGLQERSEFMVNAGVVFIALDIIATYLGLFGSMARTGLMFLISGIFLIALGVYLEQKRRALLKQLKPKGQP